MRTSGCMARIAGSMNPQLRKWPMVAGSACSSLSTSRASSAGGSALRVNTAELLYVGERGVAQPADVAARVDHLITALEHLAPGGAGMRHGAHRLAALPDAFLRPGDELCDFRVLEVAELADRAGEVVRADEEHIDTLHRGDCPNVVHRLRRFDLADDEELVGRGLAVVGRADAVVRCPRRAERRAAPPGGRIAAGGNHRAGV